MSPPIERSVARRQMTCAPRGGEERRPGGRGWGCRERRFPSTGPLYRLCSYTEVALQEDSPLGVRGSVARGHEFQYSSLDPVPSSIARVYHCGAAAARSTPRATASAMRS